MIEVTVEITCDQRGDTVKESLGGVEYGMPVDSAAEQVAEGYGYGYGYEDEDFDRLLCESCLAAASEPEAVTA
jgi:hypothetical protein